MESAVVSKWGNSSAVRLPKKFLSKLGIADNDKVNISLQGNVITIEKPREQKSLRRLVESRAGVDFDTYLKNNPYSPETDNIEFGTMGTEKL